MEKSARTGEGGGARPPTLFHSVYDHVQSCSVHSSWECRYTPPVSSRPYMYPVGKTLFWHPLYNALMKRAKNDKNTAISYITHIVTAGCPTAQHQQYLMETYSQNYRIALKWYKWLDHKNKKDIVFKILFSFEILIILNVAESVSVCACIKIKTLIAKWKTLPGNLVTVHVSTIKGEPSNPTKPLSND
jgi:hypothetical protein